MERKAVVSLREDGKIPALAWRWVRKNTMEYSREWKNGVVGEWRYWEVASLPTQREDEESIGRVGTWERADSPATPTTTQQ